MERRYKGKWVVVNAPPHEGEVDYRKDYPWGAWVEVNAIEELAQSLLPLEDRVPTRAQEWAFGRNYDSFGRLSGVRRDNQYREPNGIPKDISEQVWVDWGEDENGLADWHTPTHWALERKQAYVAWARAVVEGLPYKPAGLLAQFEAATAAAEPADEPPGVRSHAAGFRVGAGFKNANSVVAVLPTTTPPARSITPTSAASTRAGTSECRAEP
jgi:hypothetical protein